MRGLAVLMAMAARFTNLPPALTPEGLRVIAGTTYFGANDKAVRELGFAARPLDEGLAQTIEYELRALGRG
jgi:nucleoside-diphosphate-sugar epimerase